MSQSVPVAETTHQKSIPFQYTDMNYAPPTYQYYRPPQTQMRTLYTPTANAPKQSMFNQKYLKSPLGLLRLLLIVRSMLL